MLALLTVVPLAPVLPAAPIVPLDEPSVEPELLPPGLEPMVVLLPPVLEPGVLLPVVVPVPDAMVPPVVPSVEPVAAELPGVVVPELPIALVPLPALLPVVPPMVLPLVPAVFTQPGLLLALVDGVVEGVAVEGAVVDGVVVDEPSVPEVPDVLLELEVPGLLLLPVCAVATPATASDAAAAMVQSLRESVMRMSFQWRLSERP